MDEFGSGAWGSSPPTARKSIERWREKEEGGGGGPEQEEGEWAPPFLPPSLGASFVLVGRRGTSPSIPTSVRIICVSGENK